jgi:hypothetical protein
MYVSKSLTRISFLVAANSNAETVQISIAAPDRILRVGGAGGGEQIVRRDNIIKRTTYVETVRSLIPFVFKILVERDGGCAQHPCHVWLS